jgi:hypothetical protein
LKVREFYDFINLSTLKQIENLKWQKYSKTITDMWLISVLNLLYLRCEEPHGAHRVAIIFSSAPNGERIFRRNDCLFYKLFAQRNSKQTRNFLEPRNKFTALF